MEEPLVTSAPKPHLSPEQIEIRQKRETLILTKKKLQSDLERSSNPRHQEMLKRALEEVEKQLKST